MNYKDYRPLFTLLVLVIICLPVLKAQEVWSLEKCIKQAQEQSLVIKQATTKMELADVSLKSSKAARYPTLNYSSNLGNQWGRTIDFATNTYVKQTSSYNSHNLSAGLSIYEGGQINNGIKLAEYNLKASQLDTKQSMEDIALSVAATYLNILLNKEAIEVAKKRVEISQKQLEQTEKLIDAGSVPRNEKLSLMAQVAKEEENLFASQNAMELAYLDLKNALNLDPGFDMVVEEPKIDQILIDTKLITDVNDLYKEAAGRNAGVSASEMRILSAQTNKKIAGASGLPSLSAFGNISSNYSSSILDYLNPDYSKASYIDISQKVFVNGTEVTITQKQQIGIQYPKVAYFDQLNNNLGQAVGLSLRIPIYNNGIARYNKQKAEIEINSAKIISDQTKQQLKSTIFRAVADYKASRLRVEAAQREFDAATGAYNNTQKKFEAGSSNSLDLVTAKNTANTAQDNLLTARYTFVFRAKVLEYYMGKQIQLN